MRTTRRPIDNKAYENYYLQQVGQGIPVFEGANLQRGYGLGGILGGLLRSALPMLRRGVQSFGKQALSTGLNIAQDTINGQNFKAAAKRRMKETGRTLGKQVVKRMAGKRSSRKSYSKKKTIKRKRSRGSSISSRQRKRQRRSPDIFDR